MDVLAVYAPVEKHLVRWLPSVLPGVRAGTGVPASITGRFVQPRRVGGGSYLGVDYPQVQVHGYALTESDALDLGSEVQGVFEGLLRGVTVRVPTKAGSVDTSVSWRKTVGASRWVEYDNPGVFRSLTVFDLVAHHFPASP